MSSATEAAEEEPAGSSGRLPVAGIIFDLDGTLVESALDFAAMRREMGLADGLPLLEAFERLTDSEAARCREILSRHERQGAERATPVAGVPELLARIDRLGVRRAVFTRNGRPTTALTLDRCGLRFDHVITRDDGPVKPDPWAIHHLCRIWEVPPERVAVIGDFRFDIEAGRRAGAKAVLYTRGRPAEGLPGAELADWHLHSFLEPDDILAALGL